MTDQSLAALAEEVAQLRDLFQRRLLEDKAKNRLYEELYDQLNAARGKAIEQALLPLYRELLLIVDRVDGLNTAGDIVLESINDELLELLARRDVHRISHRDQFDPAIHEAVRSLPTEDRAPGTVVEVVRAGFTYKDQLLRPERVVVAIQPQPAEPKATFENGDK